MSPRTRLGIFAFVIWMALLLAAFYAVQKPITAQDVAALVEFSAAFERAPSPIMLIDSLLNLLTACAIFAAALIVGSQLLPLQYPRDEALSDRLGFWILSVGAGLGIYSLAVLGLALLQLLHGIGSWFLICLIVAWRARKKLRWLLHDLKELHTMHFPQPLAVFAFCSLTLSLLLALTPPNAFDAWLYHLTIPKRILQDGGFTHVGDILPADSFPLLMEMLYVSAMHIRGEIAAQLLHLVFCMLLLLLLVTATRSYFSRPAVVYALILALSMPMLLLLATWAYTDLPLAFYSLAAVYSFGRWQDTRANPQVQNRYLWIAALMAGFAMGLKYTSFVIPSALVLLLLRERRETFRLVFLFALISISIALPWYLKNFMFTGNPVYPFVFGGTQWDALRASWYARGGSGIGLDPLALLSLPLVVTLGYRDATYIDGRIGPMLLMFTPLLVLQMLRRRTLNPYMFVSMVGIGFWTFGVVNSSSLWQARHLLPALVLLIPPLAQAIVDLRALDTPSFSLRRIVNIVIALVLALTLVTQTVEFLKVNPLAYLVGAESREHFLLRQWGDHVAAMRALDALPSDARVQFMWEPRSYLAARSARADVLLDALPHLIATQGSLAAGVRQLKAEGFTHILIFEAGLKFAVANLRDQFDERDLEAVRALERDYARLIYANPSYRILELR